MRQLYVSVIFPQFWNKQVFSPWATTGRAQVAEQYCERGSKVVVSRWQLHSPPARAISELQLLYRKITLHDHLKTSWTEVILMTKGRQWSLSETSREGRGAKRAGLGPTWGSWKSRGRALASVAQLVPTNWKVTGSIPGQGACLGCRFSAQLGSVQETTDGRFSLTSVFLSLSSPRPLPSLWNQ